jgi:hypothetical protein
MYPGMFPGGIHAYNVMGQERATFLTMLVYSYDVRAKMVASFLASLIRVCSDLGRRLRSEVPVGTLLLPVQERSPKIPGIRR